MRKRKWKAPNNPNVQARQVWRAVYGEPWPKGWKVKWVGFMRGASGLCKYGAQEILLNYADAKKFKDSIIRTLLHEFVHVRHKKLRHGKEFERLVDWAQAKLEQANVDEASTKEQERDSDPQPEARAAFRFGSGAGDLPAMCGEGPPSGP